MESATTTTSRWHAERLTWSRTAPAILGLAATVLLAGCARLACGIPGDHTDSLAMANYSRCVAEAEREEAEREANEQKKLADQKYWEDQKKAPKAPIVTKEQAMANKAAADAANEKKYRTVNAKWNQEVKLAQEEAKAPSKYPALAGLNGIWCGMDYGGKGSYKVYYQLFVWHVVGPSQIRAVLNFEGGYGRSLKMHTYEVTAQGDLFETRHTIIYKPKDGKEKDAIVIRKYKKESATQIKFLEQHDDFFGEHVQKNGYARSKTYTKCTEKN